MFTNIYLKNYKQIFETLGQTADDIAEVSSIAAIVVIDSGLGLLESFMSKLGSLFLSLSFLLAHSQDHHHGQSPLPPPD